MKKWLRDVDNWWFGPVRPEALALLRIFVGFLTFLNLSLMTVNFWSWYSRKGLMPPELMDQELKYPSERMFDGWPIQFDLPFPLPRLSLISSSADEKWIAVVFGITLIAALLFMVGRWTRISGLVLALGVLSIHTRNIYIIHSGDTLLRMMIFYLALGNAGAAYSWDRKIAIRKGLESAAPKMISAWPQRLVAFQISLCYFITVWWKWMGNTWMNGTATWYPSQLHEFDRFPVPAFSERQPFIGITTYGTLLVELALAILVWYRPWRKWVLISGVALHAYIEYRFNIPFFAVAIVTGYISYYEGSEVAAWVQKKLTWLSRFRRRPIAEQPTATA